MKLEGEMLLSYINTKLRDYYKSLEALCDDLELSQEEIEEELKRVGYVYCAELNRFVQLST